MQDFGKRLKDKLEKLRMQSVFFGVCVIIELIVPDISQVSTMATQKISTLIK